MKSEKCEVKNGKLKMKSEKWEVKNIHKFNTNNS